MITGFSVSNFKNLSRVPGAEGSLLPFGPLNVLIGPNGCGKSSLLQAIDFLRAFFYSSVEVYLRERGWNYDDLPNLRQTRKAIRWELTARLDADEDGIGAGEYRYYVELQPRKHLGIGEESLEWTAPGQDASPVASRTVGAILLFARQHNQPAKTVPCGRRSCEHHEPVEYGQGPRTLSGTLAVPPLGRGLPVLSHLGSQGAPQSRSGKARRAWSFRRAPLRPDRPNEGQTTGSIQETCETCRAAFSHRDEHLGFRAWLGLAHFFVCTRGTAGTWSSTASK